MSTQELNNKAQSPPSMPATEADQTSAMTAQCPEPMTTTMSLPPLGIPNSAFDAEVDQLMTKADVHPSSGASAGAVAAGVTHISWDATGLSSVPEDTTADDAENFAPAVSPYAPVDSPADDAEDMAPAWPHDNDAALTSSIQAALKIQAEPVS